MGLRIVIMSSPLESFPTFRRTDATNHVLFILLGDKTRTIYVTVASNPKVVSRLKRLKK